MFYQVRNRYLEGAQIFERAVQALVLLDRTSEVGLALIALLIEAQKSGCQGQKEIQLIVFQNTPAIL
jgi:hypothetical protein